MPGIAVIVAVIDAGKILLTRREDFMPCGTSPGFQGRSSICKE